MFLMYATEIHTYGLAKKESATYKPGGALYLFYLVQYLLPNNCSLAMW